MKIAKVIVDVPVLSINQTFDYLIPEELVDVVEKGMRVVVPFGPRKTMGFIIGFDDESDFDHLKPIIEILDITPVLTEELLDLGIWLARETLSFYITAFQAMLPQILKSTYEKEIEVINKEKLPTDLQQLFHEHKVIPYDLFEKYKLSYSQLRSAVQNKAVKINYVIKSRITKKYVTEVSPNKSRDELKIELQKLRKNALRQKEIITHFIENPQTLELPRLLNKLTGKASSIRSSLRSLQDRGLIQLKQKEVYRNPYDDRSFRRTEPLPLTKEQNIAIQPILSKINNQEHGVFLLHGVTGSGKTEVYLQAIDAVLQKGKEAIVLVPEISLTPQMVKRFKERFGSEVAVLHSALSAGEKYDEWRKIHQKEVKVVVGARSAIFAPFDNLGIIIIDEEHETTYKQEEQPRYHARDVAIYRGEYYNCPVVLGSATPTLESYARAKKNVYKLLTLTERTNKKPLPRVDVIDMRKELHRGNRTMFSKKLTEAMIDRMNKGEQIVLLLNRRGFSTFIMCRDCGYVEECPNCDIALTYHKHNHLLKCHYCSFEKRTMNLCPTCSSDKIQRFGTGTQRVEEELYKHIPGVKVIRMDVDTTRRKGSHERLLTKFENKEAHILLGTQMIAKGLDFPNVTLVGVLAADSMLHLPDFRSSEKNFQLITQVSGRAGRHHLDGEVIVQTYTPDHYSIQYASTYNFDEFYKHEMNIRRTFRYPPYVYLALITVSHPNRTKTIQITQEIVRCLNGSISSDAIILGPTPSPIEKIKNRYRYQCMIKYRKEPKLKDTINRILDQFTKEMERDQLQIIVDMQPYQLM